MGCSSVTFNDLVKINFNRGVSVTRKVVKR